MNKKGLILDNIPNALTILRIVMTFIVMYMIFTGVDLRVVIVVFAFAALTDFLDGRLARKFKWESEFGRRADMIADRFLWIGTAMAFVITYGLFNNLNYIIGIQIFLIMTREIISLPFALIAFFSGNALPQARYIAKVTTFAQGFALPALIFSLLYPKFIFISFPLAIICGITGFYSAMYYIHDITPKKDGKNKKKKPKTLGKNS